MQTILPIDPTVFWMALRVGGALLVMALAFLAYRVSGAWHGSSQAGVPWEQFLERQSGTAKVLLFLVALVFLLALGASAFVLWSTIDQVRSGASQGINLGSGTLIAALLGAPFLIWGTWLKYQTVRFQKEGHMTDRISKAVEQLGAEKTVKVRIKDAEGKEITVEETKPNIEVRIGAILSLERIAQDSTIHDKGRDHVRVMEILCAYVRENAPARNARNDNPRDRWEEALSDAEDQLAPAEMDERERAFQVNGLAHQRSGVHPENLTSQVRGWVTTLAGPREDVGLALRVIGRRSLQQRQVEAAWPEPPNAKATWPFDEACPIREEDVDQTDFSEKLSQWEKRILSYRGYRIDLRDCNLQKVDPKTNRSDFPEGNFAGALLDSARLEGANLRRFNLQGASLLEAALEGSKLNGALLNAANLGLAHLDGASLRGTQAVLARFRQASIGQANLTSANLVASDLTNAQLKNANLAHCDLSLADLHYANLESCNLSYAIFRGTDFRDSILRSANLAMVKASNARAIESASLDGAALRGSDLRNLELSDAQVASMFGDESVSLKSEAARPAHWPDWKLPTSGAINFGREWRKWQADPAGYTPPPPPIVSPG